jgi:hypothetical protein
VDPQLVVDGEPEAVGGVEQGKGDQGGEVELRQREPDHAQDPLVGEGVVGEPSRGEGDPQDGHMDGEQEGGDDPAGPEQGPEQGLRAGRSRLLSFGHQNHTWR